MNLIFKKLYLHFLNLSQFFSVLVVLIVFSLLTPRLLSAKSVFSNNSNRLGELLMFGIPGPDIDKTTKSLLLKVCPGSILLFKRNLTSLSQAKNLIQELRELHSKCSTSPLFVALDQEGGPVTRVAFDPPLPSAWSIGQAQDVKLAEYLGREVGAQLRRIGFNMNLAPVLDIGPEQGNSFIGSRAYGNDPKLISGTATQFAYGLLQSHILPVAKHFPGIGASTSDPHQHLVRRTVSKTSLLKKDLVPFVSFSQVYPSGIMPSHLVYPKLDPSLLPATYSSLLLNKFLRQDIGYQGLIVSDDLQMRGAKANQKAQLADSVITSLVAGVDVAMISWSKNDQKAVYTKLENKFRSDKNFAALAREKIERILKIKRLIEPNRTLASVDKSKDFLSGCCISSHNYSTLLLDLLKKNVSQGFVGLNVMKKPRRIFIWPAEQKKIWQIERSLRLPVLSSGSKEFLKLNENDLILSFVKYKSQAKKLNAWPVSVAKNTIVINQIEPGALGNKFKEVIPLYLDHPMLAREVALGLSKRW